MGRSDELHAVKAKLFDRDDFPIISLLGLGGVGKSRSALELAHQTKSEYPQYSVFWVQAEKLLTFEEDMLHIGKKLGIPGIDDPKADVKTLVKQRLQNSPEEKWFLILNNADDEMLWGRRSNPSQQELSVEALWALGALEPKKWLKRPDAGWGAVERGLKTAPKGAVFCRLFTTTGTETFVVKTLGKGLI